MMLKGRSAVLPKLPNFRTREQPAPARAHRLEEKLMKKMVRMTSVLAGMLLASTASRAEIKVGLVTSLSGPASSIGIPYARGAAAAVEYANSVNGQKIRLIQLDDGSDPSAATRNARKLFQEEHVDLLMGTASSPSSIAMAAVANEVKVPMIAIAPITAPAAAEGDLWTIALPQPPLMIKAIADRMAHDGIKGVGYIGFSDAWGDFVYKGAKAAEANGEIKILTDQRYARTDTSVIGQVLTLLAAHPDGVLIGGSGTQGALPALTLSERGYKGPLYGTQALINSDFVLRIGGKAVEGIVVSSSPAVVAEQLPDDHYSKKISLAFRDAYLKANGAATTDAFSPYSFDGWLILIDAAKRAMTKAAPGTPEFRAALRDAIFTTTDLKGTNAIYNFHPGQLSGVDERGFLIVRLADGAWKYNP